MTCYSAKGREATIVVRVGNNRPDLGVNPICNRFTGSLEEGRPLFLPCNPPMPGAFVSVHFEGERVCLSQDDGISKGKMSPMQLSVSWRQCSGAHARRAILRGHVAHFPRNRRISYLRRRCRRRRRCNRSNSLPKPRRFRWQGAP